MISRRLAAPYCSAAGPQLCARRRLSVRTEDFFSKEAVSHTRRVSWAPHTTEKKQGAFAKLARSNFSDPLPASFTQEPYFEEEIETHRLHHRPDVYIYKYNVSPTHMSFLRESECGDTLLCTSTRCSSAMRRRRIVCAARQALLRAPARRETSAADAPEEWLRAHIRRAVREGRQTRASAEYFESIVSDQPEFRQCIRAARDLIGEQDPRALSKYQQAHYADRLSSAMSGIAAERLMRAHAEESNTRRHTQEGTPTGENYWFEAGNTLSSPSVPGFVKDDILREMRRDRPAKSPAYDEPKEVNELAATDDAFGDHLRRQRKRLLSTEDSPS